MIARFGSMLSGVAALAMVLGCYTVSLKVSGERKAVEDLRGKIAGDLRGIRTLQAELRTRSRMPELQRWNDEVLAMAAPAASQFAHDPMQLASFVAAGAQAPAAAPAAPAVRYALAEAPAPAQSPLQKIAYEAPDVSPRAATPRVSLDLDGAVTNAINAAANERATLKRVALR